MIKIEVNGEKIAYIEVNAIGFVSFTTTTENIVADSGDRKKIIQRKRIQKQSKAFSSAGTEVEFTDMDIMSLPPKIGAQLVSAINTVLNTDGQEPKILQEGDGVTSPIRIQLSKPIPFKENGREFSVDELEFQAKTFGEVESVHAEMNPMRQCIELLAGAAIPVAENLRMQRLPSWAVEHVSVVDGSFIANEVLPLFLE